MLFINVFCFALIGFIVWWFWLYNPKEATSSDAETAIVVKDGVYTPARIKVASGTPIKLTFLRQDKSGCSASLQFPDLDIYQELFLDKPTYIDIPATPKGEYVFHCQMKMYKGVLIVE